MTLTMLSHILGGATPIEVKHQVSIYD